MTKKQRSAYGENDWELSEDYYQTKPESKEWRLEDFADEEVSMAPETASQSELLQKTIKDVKAVMELALNGIPIPEIARTLHLDETYVYQIQVTAQGFREDDEVAVAHLVMMG